MQKQEFPYSSKAGVQFSSDSPWVASPWGPAPAAHLALLPWLPSSLCLAFDTGKGFCLLTAPTPSHRELPLPTLQPSQPGSPTLGQGSSKPPSSAKHTEPQHPRGTGGAHVFHYSPACEISPGTKLSTAFPLALNIFAESCQIVKEFSRRKAPLVHISRCK